MASLSWKFVEKPFRDRQIFSSATIAKASIISIIFFLCTGASGYLMDGFASRFEHNELTNTAVSSHLREKCHTDGINYLPPNQACRYYGENITWATLGDSHVAEMSLALAEQLQHSGEDLLHLSYSDCPPVFKLNIRKPGCKQWLQDSVDYLVSENSIRNVLLGFRHVFNLYGSHADVYPELPDRDPRRIKAEDFNGTRQDAEEAYWQSYQAIIDTLLKADKRVFILFSVPEVPVSIHIALRPFSIFSSQPLLNLERPLPTAFYTAKE